MALQDNGTDGDSGFVVDVALEPYDLAILGVCLLPLLLPILYILLKFLLIRVVVFMRNPVEVIQSSAKSGLVNILTFPLAWLYFRWRFDGSFFRVPTVCDDCQLQPLNRVCPKCGVMLDRSPWGRYTGGADQFMFEFARTEMEAVARRADEQEAREIFGMTSDNDPPIEQPVNYTSGLFDD